MKYRDFFSHIEKRAKKQKRAEEKLRKASEKLAERLDISTVEALSRIQNRLAEDPQSVLQEWREAKKEAPRRRKQSVDNVIERLKDEADAPSVGDKVEIQFNEEARGYLTPQQKELNGQKGEVKVRDPFSSGSQRSRYTVEVIGEGGEPHTVHNLTPGEVIPTDE